MTTPAERGDLAVSLVPLAAELAWLVRDEGREAAGEWMERHGVLIGARITGEMRAFLVVLAAMVRADVTTDELLEWLTFDEHGRPLDGTAPLFPAIAVPGGCPSMEAYRRHVKAGWGKEQIEACGCGQASRDYYTARYYRRKAEARDRPAVVEDKQQRQGEEAA